MSALSLSLMLFLLSFISQTRSSDLVRLLLSRDTVGLLAMAAPHYSLSNDLNADRADVCLYSMPLRWPPVQRRSGRAPGRKRKLILASRNDLLCSRFGLAGRQHAISRSSALSLSSSWAAPCPPLLDQEVPRRSPSSEFSHYLPLEHHLLKVVPNLSQTCLKVGPKLSQSCRISSLIIFLLTTFTTV